MPRTPKWARTLQNTRQNAEQPQAEVIGEYRIKPPLVNLHTVSPPEAPAPSTLEVTHDYNPLLENLRGGKGAEAFVTLNPGASPRRFRFKNPRSIDVEGWKGWMPVDPKDPEITVVNQMAVHVDGTIRRGGRTGHILCYVPETWAQEYEQEVVRRSEQAITNAKAQHQEFIEEHRRGRYVTGALGKWETERG